MNGITLDPVEEFFDARYLVALIDRWLTIVDVEPETRSTYCYKIRHFVRWWERVGPTVDWKLTQTTMRSFEFFLRSSAYKKPLAYTTRKAIVLSVHMMFKWACDTNRTVRNYGIWLPWPAGAASKRKAATPQHLLQLMWAAAESRRPIRDQAILAFFIGTGCRRCEVASLRAENLAILPDGSGTAIVTGKRTSADKSGVHEVAFDASTGQWLMRHMAVSNITSGPLWFGRFGQPMSVQSIYGVVTRAIKLAGLVGIVQGCHDLRRAFATILSKLHPDNPVWADMIRRQLGHKNYSQTAAYILVDVDDIRDIIPNPMGSLL